MIDASIGLWGDVLVWTRSSPTEFAAVSAILFLTVVYLCHFLTLRSEYVALSREMEDAKKYVEHLEQESAFLRELNARRNDAEHRFCDHGR